MGTDQDWEKFGRADPYFGVCADPVFRNAAVDPAAREAFFRSGEEHVERVFAIVRDHLAPDFAPRRALDFGCGVGRVAIPLARRVDEAVGVDVSPSMLAEAHRNATAAGVDNLTFVRSDDHLSALHGDFDFIHSFIVFQHIPPHRGEALLRALLARLAGGGIAALHFTYDAKLPPWRHLLQSLRRRIPFAHGIGNLLQRRPWGYPLMQMNVYDPRRLLAQLQEHGCHDVHLRFTKHGAWSGLFLFFRREEIPGL